MVAGQSGGALTGAIRRTLGRDVGGLLDRLNRLTAMQAEDIVDSGRLHSRASGLVRGASAFLRGYVARGGWREGHMGLVTALLSSLFPILSQMRANDVLNARRAVVAQAQQQMSMDKVVGLGAR